MKLAFVVHDFNRTWGHSSYVAELVERFCLEHEVHVFANTIVADERVSRVHFHKVASWRRNAFSTVLTFVLPATLGIGGGFDIIHAQGLCGLKHDIITAHQCNEEWYRLRRMTEKQLSLREHVFGLVTSKLEKMLYSWSSQAHVIAVSNRIASDLQRHYQCGAPITVVHHGVDNERFSPQRLSGTRADTRKHWGVEMDRFTFLYVGDLRKGAKQCILAMKEFPEARLVLISRSPRALWHDLALRNGLNDRVTFAGSSEAVERAFAAADAFLMPTPYDPFGLVVTEAMSSGLPVIVSAEAGASELVEHGVNGLILKDASGVDELMSHMHLISNSLETAQRLGSAARRSAEKRSWDEVAVQTMSVYRDHISARKAQLVPQASCKY